MKHGLIYYLLRAWRKRYKKSSLVITEETYENGKLVRTETKTTVN